MAEIDLDDFDFGFTTTNVDEIAAPVSQDKAQRMYNAIIPLLNNLAKDSDTNAYIHWPNRSAKIQEFKKKLDSILNS